MAIPRGLDLLRSFISGANPILPQRLRILHAWLYESLGKIRHGNGSPVVIVLTAKSSSEPNESMRPGGYIIAATFLRPDGQPISNGGFKTCYSGRYLVTRRMHVQHRWRTRLAWIQGAMGQGSKDPTLRY